MPETSEHKPKKGTRVVESRYLATTKSKELKQQPRSTVSQASVKPLRPSTASNSSARLCALAGVKNKSEIRKVSSESVTSITSRPHTAPQNDVSTEQITVARPSENHNKVDKPRIVLEMPKPKSKPKDVDTKQKIDLMKIRLLQYQFLNSKSEIAFKARKDHATKQLSTMYQNLQEKKEKVDKEIVASGIEKQKVRLLRDVEAQIATLAPAIDSWKELDLNYGKVSDSIQNLYRKMELDHVHIKDAPTLRDAIWTNGSLVSEEISRKSSDIQNISRLSKDYTKLSETVTQELALLEECRALIDDLSYVEASEKSMVAHLLQVNDTFFKGELARF